MVKMAFSLVRLKVIWNLTSLLLGNSVM